MSYLPATLPEKPTGWTKHCAVHFNFGRKGGAANHTIKDEKGRLLPICYQYDTRKGCECNNGFTLPDVERCMTWKELREEWPKWLETHKGWKGEAA